MHLSFICRHRSCYKNVELQPWGLPDAEYVFIFILLVHLFPVAQGVMVLGCVSVEQAASFPSVSLKPLAGMEGLNISASTSRPKDAAALAALMRLCQGWQKPGATIKGKCVLVSRSRLEVDIGYQADVIGIFKQMPSRCYGECNKCIAWKVRRSHFPWIRWKIWYSFTTNGQWKFNWWNSVLFSVNFIRFATFMRWIYKMKSGRRFLISHNKN